jgi:hypothetical protein
MFKFIVDGKEITDNRIHWKFKGTDLEFKSDETKLERNIQFWRNKYKVGADVEIEYLNVKKVEEDVKPIISEPVIESVVESNDSIIAEEPVVPQDTTNTVNPPRRKSTKKTTKL